MIGWLHGVLRDKRPPFLVVDVQGLGYELEAPMTTFYDLPEIGEEVTLYAHQIVRDDAHALYGFARRDERDLFRNLLRVSGVGAKLGLAILSGLDTAGFARCVFDGDAVGLARLPGIGKKTAERLIIEMRDRLEPASAGTATGGRVTSSGAAMVAAAPADEAVNALTALGFKPQDALRRVRGIDCAGLSCEEIVRIALKALVR